MVYDNDVFVYSTIELPMTGYSPATKSLIYKDRQHVVVGRNDHGIIWFYHATKITKPTKVMNDIEYDMYLNHILNLTEGAILVSWKEKIVLARHGCLLQNLPGWTTDHLTDYCPCSY